MNNTQKLQIMGLLALILLTGCGAGGEEPKAKAIDACALLQQAKPAVLLGGAVGEGRERVHRQDAEATVSMCSYAATGPGFKSVSLQVMFTPKQTNPGNAADFLKGKDFTSVGLKPPAEVHGLGDVALSSSMPGAVVLQVFWHQHYRMKVSLSGLDNPDQALEKARTVARFVMKKL